MSRRRNEIKRKAFPFIIAGIVIAAFFIVTSFFYIKPQNTGQQIISQNEGVADNQIASNKYKFNNLSISIPSGWTEIKGDNIGFVHSASNSAFYLDKFNYMPEVNLLLFQTDAPSFLPTGSYMTDYNTNGRNESTLFYEQQSNAGTYYSAKKYLWDKDEIYTITININSAYYDRLADIMDYIINNAEFNGINPIDEKIFLDYDENFRCQYGMPYGWIEENGIWSKEENTLSITILNKPDDFDISKYNSMSLQNDFPSSDAIYTSLRQEKDYMIAEGTINADNGKTSIYLKDVEINGKKYLIGFVWRYTDEEVKEIADKCIKEFKIYPEENTEKENS